MLGDVNLITIWTPTGTTYDDEGRHSSTYSSEDVWGRMTGGSASETVLFAQRGVTLDAVALVPLEVVVDTTCEVSCDDDGLTPTLGVRYKIADIRPNLSHQRLILTRQTVAGDG